VGGPFVVVEGGSVQLDGASSSDPYQPSHSLIYQWDLDGDNVFGETGASAMRGDEAGPTPIFSAVGLDGPSSFTVTLRVTDNGGLSDEIDSTITIENADPVIQDVATDGPVDEGQGVTVTVTALDAVGADDPLSYEFDFDDDGVYEVGPQSGNSASHTFGDNGTYQVNVRVTDGDDGVAASFTEVFVNNVAPTLTISGNGSVDEAAEYTLNLDSDDPGADTISGWTIDWGDGSVLETVSGNPSSVIHVYADGPHSYTISAAATDEDATDSANTLDVIVNNVAPTATDNSYTTAQGAPISGNFITDSPADSDPAGANDPLTASLETPPSNGTVVLNSDGSFTYTPDNTFSGTDSFSYTVSDGDEGEDTATVTITVLPAGVGSVLIVPDTCCNGGTALLVTGTTADDQIVVSPGTGTTVEVSINGVSSTWPTPSGRIIVIGGNGDDNIQIAGAILNQVWLYGEGGNDRLNAGNGGSLLIGGEGDDELLGGVGRDVMVGGEGADRLIGNSSDDILIAGLTLKDARTAAGHEAFWCAVLSEWNSDDGFTARIAILHPLLTPQVRDDEFEDAIDFLNGSGGDDWLLFLAGEDKVTGQVEAPN
jgi:hypothetical protein